MQNQQENHTPEKLEEPPMLLKLIHELIDNDPELNWYRQNYHCECQKRYDEVLKKDINAIKELYPDEKAEDVSELGEKFIAMMATGVIDAVSAYETIRNSKKRKDAPPSMGEISPISKQKQTYFTKEQVRAMSPKEVKKNFELIEQSMKRW